MAGMQPQMGGQQQGAAPQPQQQFSPQQLMVLLTHLMMNGGQQQPGQPMPKDGTQTAQGQLGTLLPALLQALTPQSQNPAQGGGQAPQGQQSQQQAPKQQNPQQQDPSGGVLSLLKGLNLQFK